MCYVYIFFSPSPPNKPRRHMSRLLTVMNEEREHMKATAASAGGGGGAFK